MAVLPALLQPTMRKITGNDQVALGHFGSISYFAAGAVGQLFKGKSKSTEEIKFPKGLSSYQKYEYLDYNGITYFDRMLICGR
ncbi:PTS transporter subunit IIC [Staphylococcus aureus]